MAIVLFWAPVPIFIPGVEPLVASRLRFPVLVVKVAVAVPWREIVPTADKLDKVPTLVNDEAVTPEFNVVPLKLLASTVPHEPPVTKPPVLAKLFTTWPAPQVEIVAPELPLSVMAFELVSTVKTAVPEAF
jgi:hypothetical protein